MDIKAAVTGAVVGVVLGAAIAWVAKPEPEPRAPVPSKPRDSAERPAERPTGPKPMYTGDDITAARKAAAAEARVEAENIAAKEKQERDDKIRELQAELDRTKRDLDEARKAPVVEKPPAETKTGKDPLVKFGKHADIKEIREANYEDAADANRKIMPALERILKAVAEGKEPDPADSTEISNQNARLQELAFKIIKKLPTNSPGNGEYTHPLNIANLIAHALKAAGKPLSEAQIARMAELGNQYEADYDRVQATYNENTLRLERLIDEADLKQRFYDGVVALLEQDQRDVIVSPLTYNRVRLDFYSPGLMLQGSAAPLHLTTRDDLRAELLKLAAKTWKLDLALLEGQGAVFDAYFNDLGDFLEPMAQAKAEELFTPDCIRCGRAQIKAMKAIINNLSLDRDAAKVMRSDIHVYMPRVVIPK